MTWWEERETPVRVPDENEPEEPPEVERPRSIFGEVVWPRHNRPDTPHDDGTGAGSAAVDPDESENELDPSIHSLSTPQMAEARSEALQPLDAGAADDAVEPPSDPAPTSDAAMRGGAGRDAIHGFGGDDLIFGEGGADRLIGNDGFDTLHGGDGQDRLKGEDGSDLLRGGADRDSLVGGDGDDVLFGDAGNDRLLGNLGSDLLLGGGGDDQVKGGSGFDALLGGEGLDSLLGESGRDFLFGQSGNDRLTGGSNRDTLQGGTGDDRLYGGDGDDILKGGAGDDRLWGEAGRDVFVFDLIWDGNTFTSEDGADRIYDFDLSSDLDEILFRVHTTGAALGRNAQEVFAALDATALVVDDGTGTTISVGGMSVELRGISAPGAAFTSLGGGSDPSGGIGINLASRTGEGGHDAVTVVVNEIAPIAGVSDENDEVRIDLAGIEGFEGLNLFEVTDQPSLGAAHVEGSTLVIRTGDASGAPDLLEKQLVSVGLLGFATGTAADLGTEGGALALREIWVDVSPARVDIPTGSGPVMTETLQNAPNADPSDTSVSYDLPSTPTMTPSGGSIMKNFGSNTLTGGPGPDRLIGSFLDDVISGAGGADRITGLAGNDLLSGGAGADAFVFGAGSGRDTVTDFEIGLDVLAVQGMDVDGLYDIDADGEGPRDTLVSFSTGDSVVLLGVTGVASDDLF